MTSHPKVAVVQTPKSIQRAHAYPNREWYLISKPQRDAKASLMAGDRYPVHAAVYCVRAPAPGGARTIPNFSLNLTSANDSFSRTCNSLC
jgi:hypothetical protein